MIANAPGQRRAPCARAAGATSAQAARDSDLSRVRSLPEALCGLWTECQNTWHQPAFPCACFSPHWVEGPALSNEHALGPVRGEVRGGGAGPGLRRAWARPLSSSRNGSDCPPRGKGEAHLSQREALALSPHSHSSFLCPLSALHIPAPDTTARLRDW